MIDKPKPKPLDLNFNPYPKDIFPDISKEEYKKIDELLQHKFGFTIDRLAGYISRKVLSGLKQEFTERIKAAYEFYLKYKNRSGLLIEDYPEYKKEIDEIWERYILGDEFIKAYNEWLFKLAFKSVLGDEE